MKAPKTVMRDVPNISDYSAKTSETDALTGDNSETGRSVRNMQQSSDGAIRGTGELRNMPDKPPRSSDMVERVAGLICRDVAELPGDTAPDDPEAMIVTRDELSIICERHLTDALEDSHHAELVEALRLARTAIIPQPAVVPLLSHIDNLLAKIGGDA